MLSLLALLGTLAPTLVAQTTASPTNVVLVLAVEPWASNVPPSVEYLQRGSRDWQPAAPQTRLREGDQLKTGPKGRATINFYGQCVQTLKENTLIEIGPPPSLRQKLSLMLRQGAIYLFSRTRPNTIDIHTRTVSAAIRGTEFVISHDDQDRTVLTLLDGEVELTNALGSVVLNSGQKGIAEPGQPPHKTAMLQAEGVNTIQWCLYYPAILDLDELGLGSDLEQLIQSSLTAYRQGDLLQALANYPQNREPASDAETIYFAALLLSVGQVEKAQSMLNRLEQTSGTDDRHHRLANALGTLITTVKSPSLPDLSGSAPRPLILASEWLAESYRLQSQSQLDQALAAARKATELSPRFSFAMARVAELEFSFGRISASRQAVDRSLELAPRNAQALSLNGFLLAAQNHTRAALQWFDRAIDTDPALANAWLGRGLCKIRLGQLEQSKSESKTDGRADLQTAAALEPNRSFLRSYLGKAWSQLYQDNLATKELKRATELDPLDPTPWLYSALLNRDLNRINPAIEDLENSVALNENRRLYRSRFLLDQDKAVRSANLASIYRDAGMTDVAVREAAKAVTYNYANDSAHLFLSDSYNELRDPTRFNLRYETVWFNELLLANLLAPVGGGRLSPNLSQQEYSRLFEADGLGLANSTLYRSDNKSVTEYASQFGTFGGTSYSLDLDYQHNEGVRVNNALDSIEWYSTFKQQITPHDTFLALVKYENYHSGDNFQYYEPTNARPHFRFDEYQHPIAVGFWHHEWGPGMHTLAMGGRLENEQRFRDLQVPQIRLENPIGGPIDRALYTPFDLKYHSTLEIYTAELNQIAQWNHVTLSLGGRYQWGAFDTEAMLYNLPSYVPPFLFNGTPTNTFSNEGFDRLTGYGYLTFEPVERLWLTGGFSYDDVTFPGNFRHPPLTPGQEHRYQLGPKGALVWEPIPQVTFRGIYAQSLGGVSLDESYRLEPTQLAGFPQTFRTLISESVVGSVAAPEFEVYGSALDLKFPTGTYLGFQYQRLNSDVRQDVGVFLLKDGQPPYTNSATSQNLDYHEDVFTASINQLLGDGFSIGAGYKYDRANLTISYPKISKDLLPDLEDEAELHQINGYLLYNHPSGFFARADATWYHQLKAGSGPTAAGDDFVQENLYVGYRFLHRRVEVMAGILNLSDQDYHLNPLTVYSELPRKRSFIVRLKFVF